jgi:hypothetical protein
MLAPVFFGGVRCEHSEREDAVVSAMPDEHREVDLRQVGAEVGQPGANAGVRRERRGADSDIAAALRTCFEPYMLR